MISDTNKDKAASIRAAVIAIGIAFVVVVTWLRFGYLSAERFNQWGELLPFPEYLTGTFGDSFGVLTALFSGLAFAGLVYTILLQRIELEETREVLKEQSESMRTQAVEATFFQLLQWLAEVARDIRSPNYGGNGLAAFKEHYDVFCNTVRDHLRAQLIEGFDPKAKGIFIMTLHDYMRSDDGVDLRRYFRVLYQLFKFIDENVSLARHQKVTYTDIALAQLSSYEVALLLYNGIAEASTGTQGEQLKRLIEAYGLLKNVDRSVLISAVHADPDADYFYDRNAFRVVQLVK
jgi:hypothetical protein